MITAQTGIITIKIIPRDLVSSLVNHIVQTIQTVEHSNGHGIIVRGGSWECVRINRTLQWKTPLFGLAEKKVHSNRNINSHFFVETKWCAITILYANYCILFWEYFFRPR